MFFKSSSNWHGIKDACDIVLEITFWTLGKGDCLIFGTIVSVLTFAYLNWPEFLILIE